MAFDLRLLKKLLFRLDGAADSAKATFVSHGGDAWEAEFSLHSGTLQQSPRLMVIFRNRSRPMLPQRYTLAPPGVSRVPDEAVAQLSEDELRELLSTSVKL